MTIVPLETGAAAAAFAAGQLDGVGAFAPFTTHVISGMNGLVQGSVRTDVALARSLDRAAALGFEIQA